MVSLTPARLMDTRVGQPTVDGQFAGAGVVGPGQVRDLTVVGRGGVPVAGVGAVALNVTVTEPSAWSFLTVFPKGASRPTASNLNFGPGQTVPNMVIAKVGAGGQVSFFNQAGSTHVVVDVVGWFPEAVGYASLTPARLMDTRVGQPTVDGQFAGAGVVGPGQVRDLTVVGRGGVPVAGVGAVALNVTVTEPSAWSFLTVFPKGASRPTASNLNFGPGQTVPNMVIAKVGAGGQVSFFNQVGFGRMWWSTSLGWFPEAVGYASLTPARLMDTRVGQPTVDGQFAGAGVVGPGQVRDLTVVGRGGVPVAGVGAVVLNVTVTEPSAWSFLTVFPKGVVAADGVESELRAGSDGAEPGDRQGGRRRCRCRSSTRRVRTHVVVDVVGLVPGVEWTNRCSIHCRYGVEEPAGAVGRARTTAGRRAGAVGRSPPAVLPRRRRRQPGVVAHAPHLRAAGRPARRRGSVPYAELHCHSNFSFLDGACSPEELAEEAARLGLEALALTDHDGFYGVVRFAEAARELGLPTIFGAELTLGRAAVPVGEPDPGARHRRVSHLVVLARDPRGLRAAGPGHQRRPSSRGEKGAPRRPWPTSRHSAAPAPRRRPGPLAGAHRVPQGRGARAPSRRPGRAPPAVELGRLVDAFGRDNVAVELWDHGDPLDSARNDALAAAGRARRRRPRGHQQRPLRHARRNGRLATALAAVRARRSLDEIDGWLPAAAGAHLRSGAEQARRFARYPGVVERGRRAGPRLRLRPRTSSPPTCRPTRAPTGLDEMGCLRGLAERGAERRYGPRAAERVPGAWAQIDHELAVIDQLGFPGYFLIVWDIVEFCRRHDIYCQGRGSAANSAVCFALGITKADAVPLGLLFERFLSPERDGPPDIDVDIESGRREEVIQYVYDALRPPARRPGRQRHHLPGPLGGARHGQGARLRHRPAGRLGQAGRPLERRWPASAARPADSTTSPPPCSTSPPRSSTSPATSASTPAAW